MTGNFPPDISSAEWRGYYRGQEEREAFDPDCDDGGYSGDEQGPEEG